MPRLTLHRIVAVARLLLAPISVFAFAGSAGVTALPPLGLGALAYSAILLANAAFPSRAAAELVVAGAFMLGVGWALGVRHDDGLVRLLAIGGGWIAASVPFLLRDFQQLARDYRHMSLSELRVVSGRQEGQGLRRTPRRNRRVVALLPDLRARTDVPSESSPTGPGGPSEGGHGR